ADDRGREAVAVKRVAGLWHFPILSAGRFKLTLPGRIAPMSASIDRDAERIAQWGVAPAARSGAARPDPE
ncbi:hypothetical protein, partial [Burkholderia gladioli]|uniref:hypothetical protein n=1 Tax=Burkholderia gladioli TaxID=28095 RepID=UPI001ABAC8C0